MTEWFPIFIGLGENIAIIFFFITLLTKAYPFIVRLHPTNKGIIMGVLFGALSVLGMMVPIPLAEGIIVDIRGVVIAVAALYGGPLAGLLAAAAAGVYRFNLGGIGWFPGIGAIMTATLIGIVFSEWRRGRKPLLRQEFSYALHWNMGLTLAASSLLWFLGLPQGVAWSALVQHIVPILVFYPLATLAFGYLLNYELKGMNTKQRLEESEETYRTLVESSQDFIFSCNPDGVITSVNTKFCLTIGRTRESIVGSKFTDMIAYTNAGKSWEGLLQEMISIGSSVSFEREVVMPDGRGHTYIITLTPVFGPQKSLHSVTGSVHDITGLRRKEKYIERLAYYDALTGLGNVKLLREQLQASMDQYKSSESFAVLFMGVQNFKWVNETKGHIIGEQLLKEISQRLLRCCGARETAIRFGSDEFIVVSDQYHDKDELMRTVGLINSSFEQPFLVNGALIHMNTCIGIAQYPWDGSSPEELIKNANIASYYAKELGVNRFAFFTPTMKDHVMKRSRLEEAMRTALKNNEFSLHYQPQYGTGTGVIRGFEALLRWHHPELGPIPPSDFIPIAEETGLIVPIGEWVLREACLMHSKLLQSSQMHMTMSVNVSAVQLREYDFPERMIAILQDTGMAASCLDLEITESLLMSSFDRCIEVLEQLRGLGVKISLDDFGTGYSSLHYLKRLPIDYLKIDKSFIWDITSETAEQDITESIIELVHKLGLGVVAEGIETGEQLRILERWGCDYVQGYFLSRPIASQVLPEFINDVLERNMNHVEEIAAGQA
ncbi:putative bifunctional diguanylate cyclase/phosphodiesterase [Paenibacillus swuensis]|uniref:putative bifunctional diguanylate cyclase/phosphodiesterase n=1 Tax=Paenibacillus swuensis TaxID=1178515 RepID=UPI0008384D76|nr:EAL domain-containing protein [Paenibacillus swuensis]